MDFPTVVLFDTTNVCNARCPFCPLFQGDSPSLAPKTIMSEELYEKIVSEIASWDLLPVDIVHSSNAEIFQDPKFASRMSVLKKYNLGSITTLLTNGHLMSEKLSGLALDAGIAKICLGFDGATKEVYEKHRVRCDYDRVLANLRAFLKLRQERQPGRRTTLEIKFVRTRENEHEVEAAFEMFRKFEGLGLGDLFSDALSVNWSDGAGATGYYFIGKQVKPTKPLSSCSYLQTDLQIHADGKVAACCWDYNLTVSNGGFGDLNQHTALEVWRGVNRARLQVRLRAGDPPTKCQSCMMLYDLKLPLGQLAKISKKPDFQGPTSLIYFLVT